MALSDEMRRLEKKWSGGNGWPKRLEWMEVNGLRGWIGQRVEFKFPIVAIVGENGSGKSTLLQSAASVYKSEPKATYFASDFFPDTAWENIQNASIKYAYTEGMKHNEQSIRKPTERWLANTERPIRDVVYVDLSRIQPLAVRLGYAKIAAYKHLEASSVPFDEAKLKRFSSVMGRTYDSAKIALSNLDDKREIPVATKNGISYSGYHQGSGETTILELLQAELPKYGLILIDEIESSLHPRAQRRLIRDLAEKCKEKEVQIILTTHSPYILEELPLDARMYILETDHTRKIVSGVSPEFAMSKMDDNIYPECDLYVEDNAAKIMLSELLAFHKKEVFARCSIIPFGASSVGYALGQMVNNKRFPRPSLVFVDGDSADAVGCILLPGEDAPEQVIFKDLAKRNWGELWSRIGRDISLVTDACSNAMTLSNHHDWVAGAASKLMCGGDVLWQGMCAEWAKNLSGTEAQKIYQPIEDALP
jgi:predicted ATPase